MKQIYFLFLLFTAITIQAQVPANDDCANAIVIDQANFTMNEDATQATNNSGGLDVCGSPAWGMNDGVWFKLTGTGGDVNLAVTPTGWNCQVDVYTGSCGSFTCVLGLNDGGTDGQESGVFFADNSVEYFINVGHWAYDSTNPQADSPEGPFSISVNGAILAINSTQISNFSITMNQQSQYLQLLAKDTIMQVTIFDLLGKEVLHIQPNETQSNINMNNLQSGLYIVKVQTRTQNGTYKIIKK